jgi:hypothetical protein
LPTTTNLALPYPSLSSAPNVPQDMQNLAAQVEATLGTTYASITPTFYSNANSGTAIAGGSVNVTYARWRLIAPKTCHYYGHAVINTTTGSGLAISLPSGQPALQRSFSMGHCYLQGAGSYTDSYGNGHVPVMSAPYTRFGPTSRSNAQLNILTSGDTVHWNVMYEVA